MPTNNLIVRNVNLKFSLSLLDRNRPNFQQNLSSTFCQGAWIAVWYHTWLWSSVHCAMPWAVSLSLGDDKLFLDPNTISKLYSWFYLVWYYYLSVKFVMWIVKQKIENKRYLFTKNLHILLLNNSMIMPQCQGM